MEKFLKIELPLRDKIRLLLFDFLPEKVVLKCFNVVTNVKTEEKIEISSSYSVPFEGKIEGFSDTDKSKKKIDELSDTVPFFDLIDEGKSNF